MTGNSHVQARLDSLRSELAAGEEQLRQLEARRELLNHTMLRIQGAIQVLEELVAEQA